MHLMWQGIYNKITSRYTHKETHWRKYMSMQLINAFNEARYLEKNLEVHMKMHNEEKPYQCIQCDKPFSKQVNLNIYLRIHTGENKYPEMSYYCNICYKVFSLFIFIFCKIYNIKISR